ncbi:hypothetical protein [Neisseria sp. Ec49-e6-T10]|uniref:hypothetical protein n=1 Tax=Neisseria sp. Ec49-e6-T10 TaxID=3140744 RepID=UPI003EBE6D8C
MKILQLPKVLNPVNFSRLVTVNILIRKIRRYGEIQVVSTTIVTKEKQPKLFLNVFDKETMFNAGFVSNIVQKNGVFYSEQNGVVVEWVVIKKQPQLTTQAIQDNFVFHVEG